ncbi:preprotein translocase subunit SecG [Capnocytophaga felis]|uniref:Protein-export membrane protein SecG n=1 Tax=Capnocytophaga felis TaxID=2267611 RepID=A0A5M4B6X5_9FLAO|nr:preprotein translocase subunit SecG [Capnocytophaga felis]GET45363.1 preprotein translocase subunit SecG [Capnocytophaga felis]GET47474.1 preprotein translocase subunit SecG [Capnocytophaga felis]
MTTFNIFLILIVVVCLLLALVIMVQNPKGGGLSSSFGGNTQVVGGVKKTGDFLERSTWTFATLLAVLILVANTLLQSSATTGSDSKLLDGGAPVQNNILNTPASTNGAQQPGTTSNTAQ